MRTVSQSISRYRPWTSKDVARMGLSVCDHHPIPVTGNLQVASRS